MTNPCNKNALSGYLLSTMPPQHVDRIAHNNEQGELNMNLIKKRTLAAVASLVLVSGAARPQSPAPAFEVVDIKPSAPSSPLNQKGQVLPGGRLEVPGATLKDLMSMAMAELANQLPGWAGIGIDLPVVDQTGLKGAFDFELEVGMPSRVEASRIGESGPTFDPGPTVFSALDQIGLELRSRQMTVPV